MSNSRLLHYPHVPAEWNLTIIDAPTEATCSFSGTLKTMGNDRPSQPTPRTAIDHLGTLSEVFSQRQAVRLAHHTPPGLTVDTYAGHLLLTAYAPFPENHLHHIAQTWLHALADARLPAIGATLRSRPDNLSHHQPDPAPQTLIPPAPPPRWLVSEYHWQFNVGFEDAGFATGLFLDAAIARLLVHDIAADRDVLNLFSYTGPFSIAAARGGAKSIIEVDTSKKWLDWAKLNQQTNHLTTIRQRRNDAVSFIQRQDKDSFDLIICDPPSYANPKNGPRFTIEQGYKLMAPAFRRALRPGGQLIAMCNHAQTDPRQFRRWLPRELRFDRWIALPPDFANADYLKIALLSKV